MPPGGRGLNIAALMGLEYFVLETRPVTWEPQGLRPLEKCVGHSLKNLGSCQKTLRPTWCPNLVTGMLETFEFTQHYLLCK